MVYHHCEENVFQARNFAVEERASNSTDRIQDVVNDSRKPKKLLKASDVQEGTMFRLNSLHSGAPTWLRSRGLRLEKPSKTELSQQHLSGTIKGFQLYIIFHILGTNSALQGGEGCPTNLALVGDETEGRGVAGFTDGGHGRWAFESCLASFMGVGREIEC